MKTLLAIYDFLRRRRWLSATIAAATAAVLVAVAATLRYQEDIAAFLPLDKEQRRAMTLYQHIAASDRIAVLFELRDTMATADPDRLIAAVDTFAARWGEATFSPRIDYDRLATYADFLYDQMPLFLTDADYERIKAAARDTAFVGRTLGEVRARLTAFADEGTTERLRRDPLGLFAPVVARLQQYQAGVRHNLHDGYIFTPDDRKAVAMLTSPHGASETARNGVLVAAIDSVIAATEAALPDVYVHAVGAATIAVTNAAQIKADSLTAVAIAAVVILALLLYTFRSVRPLLLTAVAVAFGWLFAMAGVALIHSEISIIVLGIASVIVGIAVNYPLHYVAHLRHCPEPRRALSEIVAPLVIGNVTTVGAFLCLVPLDAAALRDLGWFSSLMLVGTMLFVVVLLPQAVSPRPAASSPPEAAPQPSAVGTGAGEMRPPVRPSKPHPSGRGWGKASLFLLLTLYLGYRATGVTFDSDLHNINYMTAAQQRDLAAFADLQGEARTATVYAAATGPTWDATLAAAEQQGAAIRQLLAEGSIVSVKTPTDFFPSAATQAVRRERWQAFQSEYVDALAARLRREAVAIGFTPTAFDPFETLLRQYKESTAVNAPALSWEDFRPLAEGIFGNYFAEVDGCRVAVAQLQVEPGREAEVEATLGKVSPDLFVFDIARVNSSISATLSDEFNYIGWACGLIVFLFLWLSFGRIELAGLAFLPMAVSWLWILGIMEILDIRFNIVNIILATFIFGQGDDYTIFITEGLIHEYAYRRRMLASYKQGILLSALIMFVGIGSLIVARHPALHSLAEVTIVGMASVVLMAWTLPPVVFGWLTRRRDGTERDVPLTLATTLRPVGRPSSPTSVDECRRYVLAQYAYKGADVERHARRLFARHAAELSRMEQYGGAGSVLLYGGATTAAGLVFSLLHPTTEAWLVVNDADGVRLATAHTAWPATVRVVAIGDMPEALSRTATATFDFR